MFMKESDPLDTLLRECKLPAPTAELDQRVVSAYRSAVRPPRVSPPAWRQFWAMRVSVPAPALLAAAALAIFAVVFWLWPSAATTHSPETPGIVTRLNVSGFQPLPNGVARIVPVMEVQK
jgi:hypothetical protein